MSHAARGDATRRARGFCFCLALSLAPMRTLRYHATDTHTPPLLDAYAGRERVGATLQVLTQLPTVFAAAAMKRTLTSSLSEVLGLSPTHVSNGGLATLKPNKQKKVLENALAFGKAQALKNGWSEEDFQRTQDTLPRLANGFGAPLASWLHYMQSPELIPLPLSIALALEMDELLDVLQEAVREDDPVEFRDAVLEAIMEDVTENPAEADAAMVEAWSGTESWDDITDHFVALIQVLMVSLFAAIDVEWGSRYFRSFEPRPVFLWVAPRMNPSLAQAGKTSKRNRTFRPTRRLLELSFAVAQYAYLGTWSDSPPGRSMIAAAFKLEDYVVGNLFDGTRKLGFAEFQSCWERMCKQPTWQTKRAGMMVTPTVLANIALGMEAVLVETGPKMEFLSALLLDEADYRGRWAYFRKRWANELAGNGAATAIEQWPGWLRAQTIVPAAPSGG